MCTKWMERGSPGSQRNPEPERRSLQESCTTSECSVTSARWTINKDGRAGQRVFEGNQWFFHFFREFKPTIWGLEKARKCLRPHHTKSTKSSGVSAEFTPTHSINNTFSPLGKMTGKHALVGAGENKTRVLLRKMQATYCRKCWKDYLCWGKFFRTWWV